MVVRGGMCCDLLPVDTNYGGCYGKRSRRLQVRNKRNLVCLWMLSLLFVFKLPAFVWGIL